MTTEQMTPAQWSDILDADPAALGAYSDWLEENGFPAIAAQVRTLPQVVAAMRGQKEFCVRTLAHGLIPSRRVRVVKRLDIRLKGDVGGEAQPGTWQVNGYGVGVLDNTPEESLALNALAIGCVSGHAGECWPLRAWFERVTGWRFYAHYRQAAEGETLLVVFRIPQE